MDQTSQDVHSDDCLAYLVICRYRCEQDKNFAKIYQILMNKIQENSLTPKMRESEIRGSTVDVLVLNKIQFLNHHQHSGIVVMHMIDTFTGSL